MKLDEIFAVQHTCQQGGDFFKQVSLPLHVQGVPERLHMLYCADCSAEAGTPYAQLMVFQAAIKCQS